MLLLLLGASLVPMVLTVGIHRWMAWRLGRDVAAQTRETLIDVARHDLLRMVRDYDTIFDLNRVLLEMACRLQAQSVESALAGPAPEDDLPPYGQFGYVEELSETFDPQHVYRRRNPDGGFRKLAVSYRHQGMHIAPGVSPEAVRDDLMRLSTLTRTCHTIRRVRPALVYRQYTTLASGAHVAYPGGDRPPADFDPRTRPWYVNARNAKEPIWSVPYIDATTDKVVLTVSMPVRRPDGTFAGVTALDVDLPDVFTGLELPETWAQQAVRMTVLLGAEVVPDPRRPLILMHDDFEETTRFQGDRLVLKYLDADDPEALRVLVDDCLAGNPGVRRMGYRGHDCFWAYGSAATKTAVPVVIVPCEPVIARAAAQERSVRDATILGLQYTGVLMIAVLAAVVALAVVRSRKMGAPILQIAHGARRLAGGDFAARVDIRTGDELQELGGAFNRIGPQLAERERMKRSLALAMEVQQHLLPQSPPSLEGFDIAGRSVYCDETGGDYYDFIDLARVGPDRVGVAVGDVSGHGVGAALLMASVRGVLRSRADLHGNDLVRLFDALNDHLVEDVGAGKFMTMFYGVLHGPDRTLEWISAGHGPLLMFRADGNVEELHCTGIPLGIDRGVNYEPGAVLRFGEGDVFVVATDGFWEARGASGDMFGRERINEVVRANLEHSAQGIHDAIEDAVARFCVGRPQEDDITAVVVKGV